MAEIMSLQQKISEMQEESKTLNGELTYWAYGRSCLPSQVGSSKAVCWYHLKQCVSKHSSLIPNNNGYVLIGFLVCVTRYSLYMSRAIPCMCHALFLCHGPRVLHLIGRNFLTMKIVDFYTIQPDFSWNHWFFCRSFLTC